MEHKCKIGGNSLRNRDGVNEDRISELPEALLLQILSLVPTKDVIATSVLSKRWRSLWKLVPNLKFEFWGKNKNLKFDSEDKWSSSENVYRCLILNKAPFLESVHLFIEDESRVDMGILIGIAFAHGVRELVVDLRSEYYDTVRFPSVLCSYNNTLEILKLKYDVLLEFPCRVCFNSLRELHLYRVKFKNKESVCNLLSGCPSLEDLVVRRDSSWDVDTYTIAVPSLQRLTIQEDHLADVDGGGYVINAPSLKYLKIKSLFGIDFCLIENAPELVEAKIINVVYSIPNENIFASLTSAKRLSLHLPLQINCPTGGSIFYQLVSLELLTSEIKWWNLLWFMLGTSPKLQILTLIDPRRYIDKEIQVDGNWNEPKCVPDCLLLHLETFVWIRYEWQREDEREVATYILKNARQLKKATISTKRIKPEELEKLEKRREMLNELARSSSSCHLVFKTKVHVT